MSAKWYNQYKWQNEDAPKARESADYQCEMCEKTNEEHLNDNGCRLHVHHLIKRRYFEQAMEDEECDIPDDELRKMANSQENLVALCASCHKKKIEVLTVDEQCRVLQVENPVSLFDLPDSVVESIN